MLGRSQASPVADLGRPMSHGSSSPEVMRPNLAGIKSRTSQLHYQSPQEANANSYSPATDLSPGTYSGTTSSAATENFQPGGFKRSNSDSLSRHETPIPTPGSRPPQRHASFGMSDAKPVDFSRPPLQTNVGPYAHMSSASGTPTYHNAQSSAPPYVNQQNFTPFSLPPPGFSTAPTTTASTRESEPSYPTSMSTDYPSEGIHHAQSGPDMMLLDQMTVPNTMPVFGGEGYNRSPFAIPEDFVAYLFNGQQMENPSTLGQMGQPGYAKSVLNLYIPLLMLTSASSYPEAQNQYFTNFYPSDVNLGGFFPANQQSHHPMAVTSLLDTTLPETILSEEKSQAIVDLIKERFNETDHAPVARQKEALLEGDRSDENHLLSRKMMQTYIGSYWYHFSEQVPICRQISLKITLRRVD